ncbi:MAG: IclR family transcriptional regulator [Solirubrobacterales bacterium]|nr:IclR family transcriptional regulator [Solirubrobacterales bacterium]
MAKSTTLRYLATLVQLRVLERDERGRFRLGLKLVELAGGRLGNDDLASVAEPLLRQLVILSGETVHLGVPSGAHMVYIAKVESPQAIRLVSRIGSRVPMYSSAMGKALLARLAPERRSELLGRLEPRTPKTIVDARALAAELEETRKRGFSIDDEENETGVRCVGAVVLATGGEPLGAVSVSGPAGRLGLRRCRDLAPELIEATREIARRLGHSPATDGDLAEGVATTNPGRRGG